MNKISIIIPCYNVEAYVTQCLSSIVNQTYSNLEIICINDGSKDNTLNIIRQFALKDPRMVVIDQDNRGISATRNVGVNYASGDFIVFVDADDWLSLDALESLIGGMEDYDLLVFSYWRELGTSSLTKKLGVQGLFHAHKFQRILIGQVGSELKNLSSFDALAPVWGKIYRADLIKDRVEFTSLKEIGTWEDGLFNVQYLENCQKVFVIDEPFYHYRKTNAFSFTNTYQKDLFEKWLYKFSLLQDLIRKKDYEFHIALENRMVATFFNLSLVETRSPLSFYSKRDTIKNIMNAPLYRRAFENLKIQDMPFLWQPFFLIAKLRLPFLVLLIVGTIDKLLFLRNKWK